MLGASAAGLWLLVQLWPVVLLFVVSMMFAAAVSPPVEWLMRRGRSRTFSVLLVMFGVIWAVVVCALVVVPAVIEEGRHLVEQLPLLRSHASHLLGRAGAANLAEQVRYGELSDLVGSGALAGAGRRVLNVFTATVTILVLTTYILLDARHIEQFVYWVTPSCYHLHIRHLTRALRRVVGGYILGQALTSGFIATFTFLTLLAVGVPNALALAVLAGIADLIPMIGVFIAVIPATLAALSVSIPKALIVAGALMFYQELENRILVQRIYGATLRLPAVVVLLSLLIGAELLGVAGALLSLPAASTLRVLIEYAHRVHRDRASAFSMAGDDDDTEAAAAAPLPLTPEPVVTPLRRAS